MMNGKALNGLCKVLNVFQDGVRMDYPVVVDKACVIMCEVEQTPMFGVECGHGLDVGTILKMKIEDEDFDVSIRDGRYVLANGNREYSFPLLDEAGLPKPKKPIFDTSAVIETDAKTLLKATEKCQLISDYCTIADGRMRAEGVDTEVSIVLGKDDGSRCVSRFPLDYMKMIAKVMTGKVRLEFDTDYPIRMTWTDGYYDYEVMLAPRIEHGDE